MKDFPSVMQLQSYSHLTPYLRQFLPGGQALFSPENYRRIKELHSLGVYQQALGRIPTEVPSSGGASQGSKQSFNPTPFNMAPRPTSMPKSGFKGVHWVKQSNKWKASIGYNKKNYHLGLFSDPEKAFLVYQDAAKKLHSHNEQNIVNF